MTTKNTAINVYNKSWYDSVWKNYKIPKANFWPHWTIIKPLLKGESLEIGPGTKPKLPVKGNHFIEISFVAAEKLKDLGGRIYELDLADRFPFPGEKFNLICAFEVLEHIPNDVFVLREISRTLKKNGTCLMSFPLNMQFWNSYDKTVGHIRRYSPKEIEDIFNMCGLEIIRYASVNIPWPGKISGYLLSFVAKNFPFLFAKIAELLDVRRNSPLRMPISPINWDKKSYGELSDSTTGFFMLRKSKKLE